MKYSSKKREQSVALKRALERAGLTVNQASKLGIRYDTVWSQFTGRRGISPEMALEYEAKLGIPRSEMRPDLWPPLEAQKETA